jgi:hypothetical protein
VTDPGQPYLSGSWRRGHVLSRAVTLSHQIADLLTAIAERIDPLPSFADGYPVQRVLGAVQENAASDSKWITVPTAAN